MNYTDAELVALREEYGGGATDAQWTVFLSECKSRDLEPGRHVVLQIRSSQEWDPELKAKRFVKKAIKITTLDALRLIAIRTGEFQGQAEPDWVYLDDASLPLIVAHVPLPDKLPYAARAKVFRKNFTEPLVSVARWDAYVQLSKDQSGGYGPNSVWSKRGPEQLFKCAVALSMRSAFPAELTGLYLNEEIQNETEPPKQEAPGVNQEPVVVREMPKLPPINHEPAAAVERTGENSGTQTINLREKISEATEQAIAASSSISGVSAKKRGRPPKSPIVGQVPRAEIPSDIGKNIGNKTEEKPSTTVSTTGYEVQEEDIPAVLSRLPTDEERKEFVARARKYVELARKHSESDLLVKAFLMKDGNEDTQKITFQQWTDGLTDLDSALKGGEDVVIKLLKGEK